LAEENRFLVGPNISGMEFIVPNVPIMDLRCRISWWDVCPDTELALDRKSINKNPPKYILWLQNPEFVMQGHERGFRDKVGESELRLLSRDILSFSESSNYRVVFSEFYGMNDPINLENNAVLMFLVRND
jgi:hypothetical protein